jgi:hypothetical protein
MAKKNADKAKPTSAWLTIIPIILTAIGLAFTIYQGTKADHEEEKTSWKETKRVYSEISELTGKLTTAKRMNDSTALDSLFNIFNEYRITKIKIVNESPRVNNQMTLLYSYLDDAVHGIDDGTNSNALEMACRQLADSIRVSINEGDSRY